MSKKLVQINVVCNGSTGRIMEQIQKAAEEHGYEAYSFYGRGKPSNDKCFKIGNKFDVLWNLFLTRVFDKHGYGSKRATKKLVKEINLTKPDIVLFTGDLVDKNTEYNKEIDNILIENLKNINAYYGKYYVNGDEDLLYKTFDTIMSNSNFISLDDTYEVIYNEKNETIFLSGISPDKSLTNEIKENINLNTYNYKILLTHYPDSVTSVLKYNFDLIASGHSLNGQVRLPFIGSVYTKENSRKYYNSYYKIDNTNLYISSGIGNSTINIRLNNPPSFNLYRIVNR